MSFAKNKRFWKDVAVAPTDSGFVIELDGRRVKTPARAELRVPTLAAAELVAGEWDAQDGELEPTSMPATRWANLAVDKLAESHGPVVDMLAEYGGSDLLCYRATTPQSLIERQAAVWDGPLEWAANTFRAPLKVTSGVIPVEQPNHSLGNLRAAVAEFGPFSLAALHELVVISGSLVLALAVAENETDAATAWDVSRVDENWQIDQWGSDEEAEQMAALKRESFVFAETLLKSIADKTI